MKYDSMKPINEKIISNKVDKTVKSQIDLLNIVPLNLNNWDKNKSWTIIKNKLAHTNKTTFVWACSLAASISMVIGAGLSYFDYEFKIEEPYSQTKEIVLTNDLEESASISNDHSLSTQKGYLELVESKKVSLNHSQKNTPIPIPTAKKFYTVSQTSPKRLRSLQSNIQPNFSLGYSSTTSISPSLGIDVQLFTKNGKKASHSFYVGTNTEWIQTHRERGVEGHINQYASLRYDRVNNQSQSLWSGRASILINPDGVYLKDTTMKFVLSKSIGRHFSIGPEVLFTNNLKKVIPGIRVILS